MARTDDERNKQREDLPGPADDPDTSMIGSTDKRGSENRQKGLQKDRENMHDGEAAPDRDEA